MARATKFFISMQVIFLYFFNLIYIMWRFPARTPIDNIVFAFFITIAIFVVYFIYLFKNKDNLIALFFLNIFHNAIWLGCFEASYSTSSL